VLTEIDVGTVRFAEPIYLWLLVAPAVVTVVWVWQLVRRRRDARQYGSIAGCRCASGSRFSAA
jgi:hypothetical protein